MTHLELIHSLKPGDWIHFNPNVFESYHRYSKIVSVKHDDFNVSFVHYGLMDSPTQPPEVYLQRINHFSNGNDDLLKLERVDVSEVVDFVSKAICNIGIEQWNEVDLLRRRVTVSK